MWTVMRHTVFMVTHDVDEALLLIERGGIAMITRAEATAQILAAKKAKELTFASIAEAVGRHKVWVTSALMGQAPMSAEEAHAAVQVLGLAPRLLRHCKTFL